jgi:hypothetical protein
VKRTEDTRSLDEKLYKIRVVIPKELVGSKNPEDGFVIQESSSTGIRMILILVFHLLQHPTMSITEIQDLLVLVLVRPQP